MGSIAWGHVARYGVPGLLAGVVVSMGLGGWRAPSARAQSQPPAQAPAIHRPEASGTIAFTSAPSGNAQFLYLIDTRAQTFAVYRVDPQNPKGTVKLEAARHYQYDLRLAEYNNQAPEVSAIESMVRTTK